MGSADVVPGVSGGTIAFITGIYEKLLQSIKNCDLQAFGYLKRFEIKALWEHINGTFLVVLLAGIATSILKTPLTIASIGPIKKLEFLDKIHNRLN